MKKFLIWTIVTAVLMIGCPFLAQKFAGDAGMAVCFVLFFAVNPVYCVICGIFAGADIKRLWALPIIIAALFVAGVWIFFEMGEPDFLIYSAIYLVLGLIAMLVSALVKSKLKL